MRTIDLNADLGEADTPAGQQAERDILRYISSANIACGGHAGDASTMRATIKAAKANNVVIGAHPSYPDRENFGRKSLVLDGDIDAVALKLSLQSQIISLMDIAADEGAHIAYVKPHGALYNDAVFNANLAALIVDVVAALEPELIFMGAPHSELEKAAKAKGLEFVSEGFIDRRYTDDGHLQSRSVEGAVITDQTVRMTQTLSLAQDQTVTTASGKHLSIPARTLCLHGDSAGAVKTARLARKTIEAAGITIKAFAHGR